MVGQTAEVFQIDTWIGEVRGMIVERKLVERTITYIHPTIPGIGMPSNTVTGWFEQITYDDYPEAFDEVPLYVENHYRHAGHGAVEEYYYMPDGELVCCISETVIHNGGMNTYTSTFYFDDGELIFFIGNRGPIGPSNFSTEAMQRAQNRVTQGEELYQLFMDDPPVPVPCIFWERW
jgi:hypothetical protein